MPRAGVLYDGETVINERGRHANHRSSDRGTRRRPVGKHDDDAIADYVKERLGHQPAVVELTDRYIIGDGDRELHIMDIGPTPHSEHILAAYLPGEKILFAADLFVLGGRRTPVKPAMANGLALFEQISNQNLDVERIVDPHSPLIATMTDLQQSVDRLRDAPTDIASRARSNLTAWRTADEHVRQPLALQPAPK